MASELEDEMNHSSIRHSTGAQAWWVNLHPPPTAHVPGSLAQSDPVFSEGGGRGTGQSLAGNKYGNCAHLGDTHTQG